MAKGAANPLLFDKRVVERNIKKGLITREEYEKYLSALPDVSDQAEVIQARLGSEEEQQPPTTETPPPAEPLSPDNG